MATKYVFVVGGVVSGLGKGITAASLGRLLKSRGLKITMQKLDPYLNVDPGTMNPYQHGEVYVTEDGGETDLDIGHYERFIDESLNKYCNVTLHECELYLQSRDIDMTRNDIAECYMAIGGIPYYWRLLTRGYSLAQNFDSMFFSDSAPLKGEFAELYASLFKNAPMYMKIVSALATRKCGMTRHEMTQVANIKDTGVVSDALDTLEESGFIRRYRFFGKKKRESVYQLIDNFTLFHFQFLGNATMDQHFWTNTISSAKQAAWRGLAFERLCLQHSWQMLKALEIAGLHTEIYAWRHTGDSIYPKGAQIDLILDRADNVINICEMKYSNGRYLLDKETLESLNEKIEVFRAVSKTRKALHLTMVTSNGLVDNAYANQIQSEITLADLFAE